MKKTKLKVGIVGCGNISDIYLKNCTQFSQLEVVGCADLLLERAQAKVEQYGLAKAYSVEQILADPEIDIIVNLTIPNAHADLAFKAVNAGKSVYNEKPLTISLEDGEKLIALAAEKGLKVGSAPDTFMGAAIQTCRKLIDDGAIGTPISFSANMACHGHESWHPDPAFYYKEGGGPLFDMGPYYLTALVALMGPIKSVASQAQITFAERTITSEPKKGEKIEVETPTHITSILNFENGALGTLITSFDLWANSLPTLEIYGSEGSLVVPDPNGFGGDVQLWQSEDKAWKSIALTHQYAFNSRGLGVADMANCILNAETDFCANGDLALHVLESMHAILTSAKQGQLIQIKNSCNQPKVVPTFGIS